MIFTGKESSIAVMKKGFDMLMEFGADPNTMANDGSTPLKQTFITSQQVNEEKMKSEETKPRTDDDEPKRNSEEVKPRTDDDGDDIITSMVSGLLSAGADPNLRKADSDTPLKCAINAGCVEGAKLLLSAGADVHATDRYSKSAVNVLCSKTGMCCTIICADSITLLYPAFRESGGH